MNDDAGSNMTDTAKIARVADGIQAVRRAIGHAVIGHEDIIDQVLIALLCGGHVLLEGVPGLGKTLLVRALARAFDGRFARVQFTPDLMPSDVTGHALYDPKSERFTIRRGPVFTNLLLADEINRAPAKTQAALLEVMQELQVTIEGRSIPVAQPFMAVATQNPIEHEGTYPLPEAQLDRFLLKVLIEYPDSDTEARLVRQVVHGQVGDGLNVESVPSVIDAPALLDAQKTTAFLHVEPRVVDYAVAIATATRDWPGISVGAGPRGSIAMVRAARAAALLDGRGFVTADDVKRIAVPALRHRIILAPEMEIEAHRPDDLLADVLEKVKAPRQ